MGFLSFRDEQPGDVQGNLLHPEGSAIIDASEPTRAMAHRRLHDEVNQRGGKQRTHAAINRIANETLTGETTEDLYQTLGLKQGDLSKLPTQLKEAFMTGDIAAHHQIVSDDAQGHYPAVDSARKGYRKASKLFPWNE